MFDRIKGGGQQGHRVVLPGVVIKEGNVSSSWDRGRMSEGKGKAKIIFHASSEEEDDDEWLNFPVGGSSLSHHEYMQSGEGCSRRRHDEVGLSRGVANGLEIINMKDYQVK